MKVIDLLNKIANGEEVPIFKYEGHRCKYSEATEMFDDLDNDERCKSEIYFSELNDEVEILEEEKKIPEKLGYFDLTKDKNEKDENGNDLELHYTGVADTFDDVYEKINEIIDYLKSKGE